MQVILLPQLSGAGHVQPDKLLTAFGPETVWKNGRKAVKEHWLKVPGIKKDQIQPITMC
jgi:hypothetical protein